MPPSYSEHRHAERGGLRPVHVSLLDAATNANENAVALALKAGSDVNACDSTGRTVVGCAIGGERWEDVDASDASFMLPKRMRILKMLLEHTDISLHALNAPQTAIRGSTPLGLAAWLNIPDMVQLLLEHCPGIVSVDGMDPLGGTPLMYAARDGNIQVVQCLLANGARPDYRDINHRTSVQHALRHPQVLWLCESALRRHRAREHLRDRKRNLTDLPRDIDQCLSSTPVAQCHPQLVPSPSKEVILSLTHTLLTAIFSANIQQLQQLLFSPIPSISALPSSLPILVNAPDAHGWSPIHHCVSVESPSIPVLDLLYRAGADVSLYTSSGHGTPLHCLAHKARASTSASIHYFVRHFILDLRAPLSARDHNKATCIHVAAEYGESAEVLAALLSCDITGVVREMRDSRGMTALEVAKPQFRTIFGTSVEQARCASSASVRTIKPSTTSIQSTSSLASVVAANLRRQYKAEHTRLVQDTPIVDFSTLPLRILDDLRCTSQQLTTEPEDLDFISVESALRQVADMSEELVVHMQSRVNDAVEELQEMRSKFRQVDLVVDAVTRLVENAFGERLVEIERVWDAPDSVRRRTTDSGDSESTAVSDDRGVISLSKQSSSSSLHSKMVDVAVSADVDDSAISYSFSVAPHSISSPSFRELANVGPALAEYQVNRMVPSAEERGILRLMSPWVKDLPRKKSKGNFKTKSLGDLRASSRLTTEVADRSASKLKAWFKRRLLPDISTNLVIVKDIDEEGCSAGREVKATGPPQTSTDSNTTEDSQAQESKRNALAAARKILSISSKDLNRIQDCIDSADRYITLANRSISQSERIIKKCLTSRESTLDRLRHIQNMQEIEELRDVILSNSPELQDDTLLEDCIDFPPITIPTSPRNSQLIFPRPPLSSKSSMTSLTSTLIDGDEEDIRALRRLLTRKIEERTDGALDEIEKVVHWLRIVKDVNLGLRKRTLLNL